MFDEIISNIPQPEIDQDECYKQDGLLYCSKCKTPRQTRINIFGSDRIVYAMCTCQSEEEKMRELAFKTKMSNEEIERSRSMAIDSPEFRTHTFANDNGRQPQMKNARKYAEDFENKLRNGSGLLIYGPCGTGKSYASDAIANRLIDRGFPVLVTKIGKIAEKVSAASFEEKGYYFSSLTKYPLLIIDDLGVERETEYMNEILNRVIDDRERSGKPIIVTTNFTKQEMENPPSDDWARVFSRLFKRCYPLNFTGADLRKYEHMAMRKELNDFYDAM